MLLVVALNTIAELASRRLKILMTQIIMLTASNLPIFVQADLLASPMDSTLLAMDQDTIEMAFGQIFADSS